MVFSSSVFHSFLQGCVTFNCFCKVIFSGKVLLCLSLHVEFSITISFTINVFSVQSFPIFFAMDLKTLVYFHFLSVALWTFHISIDCAMFREHSSGIHFIVCFQLCLFCSSSYSLFLFGKHNLNFNNLSGSLFGYDHFPIVLRIVLFNFLCLFCLHELNPLSVDFAFTYRNFGLAINAG